MAQYQYATFDPRQIDAARAANEEVFALGHVYGIEVTVPALAARCVANIDPQHGEGGNADLAAIEVVLWATLPADGTVFATIRADLDSVGSMALFSLRRRGLIPRDEDEAADIMSRIRQVADADKFVRGGYPGPVPMPTTDNTWPEQGASAEGSRPLAAIAAAVMDFRVPMDRRVEFMEEWLLSGKEPDGYREKVEAERLDLVRALSDGTIKVSVVAEGRVAVVESTHRAATSVGYAHAPVVVAKNTAFRLGGGEPHTKYTVCAFEPRFADIKSALAELNGMEAGWGGSPTIGGSPQGVSSTLTTEQVVEVVARHLK
jgi:hypothetical protein